jgi:hypothetical protein
MDLSAFSGTTERGGTMDYKAPLVEVIGAASELIQAYIGPRYDGGGYVNSLGFVIAPLEEEDQRAK